MNGFVIMILFILAIPAAGLLMTYVILPAGIWIADTIKKCSLFFEHKTPKTAKIVGSIMFWIWALIFTGLICFVIFKSCSESVENSNFEYFDDAHRPDRF